MEFVYGVLYDGLRVEYEPVIKMSKPLEQLQNLFRTDHRGAVAIYLFGSTARGTDSPGSDIDIGVLYREPPLRSLDDPSFSLKGDIEATLHRPVDLVVLNHASADLCHRVFRDGILVLDRDRAFRIRFEVRKRNEYLDLLPVLRRYRRYPEERAGR
jgi:predicted nucleotidyltransferase